MSRARSGKHETKKRPFVYGSVKPDISQARQSAYDWHGRLWSPLLYCFASVDCRIGDETFRKELLKEVVLAMKAVEANPCLYEGDEPAKLENLRRFIETLKVGSLEGVRH